MTPTRCFLSLAIAAVLGGCAGSPAYTCSDDPTGLACTSQSAIHAAVQDGSIEARQQGGDAASEPEEVLQADSDVPGAATRSIEPGDPLFVAPEPMRIWFADWRDAGDDLHSESYVYIRVGAGSWRIGERVTP